VAKTVIDLFCGAGGLSEGFRQAGFSILAGNDFNHCAGETFMASHAGAKFLEGPIEEFSVRDILNATGLRAGELDCLIGGPPCQAFSVYNHQRGLHDKRSDLFKEYLRCVEGLKPKWVVMENVTGINSVGNGKAVREIMLRLGLLGYRVEKRILRAEEFGVPQERRRIFFIGNRLGLPIFWPNPTHGNGRLSLVTISDALSDLPELKNGEDPGAQSYRTSVSSDYQKKLRGTSTMVHNHGAPRLSRINLERMKHIPQGGSWRDVPVDLLPKGMKRARRCDHTKRYGRLHPDGLSGTILTKCDIHWGAFIHPEQNRSLTVREAARLQSFPDWFIFSGPRTEQYVQVGNAVPPLVGAKIANAVLAASGKMCDASVQEFALAV